MLQSPHHAHFTGILIWALDRLWRRGHDDLPRHLRLLWEPDATYGPISAVATTLRPVCATVGILVLRLCSANQKSESIKAGMATRQPQLRR